ncbi:MAG: inorganic phosphate transporter [Chloroflexi bacterium]|nr:inorganic phosphate transporter [Chloroflexota bacterium]
MLDSSLVLLVLVLLLGVVFDFTNGFHDAANAIATSVSTRVLSPPAAILLAATMNFIGAFTGTAVAKTVGAGLVNPEAITLSAVVAALVAASAWSLVTALVGLPLSSSHSLMGGLVGAGLASGGAEALVWSGIQKTFLGLLLSPFFGFFAGMLLMATLARLFQRAAPATVSGVFRYLQIASAAFMAFSQGTNDAQKTNGEMTMALVTHGYLQDFHVPWWVVVIAASAMALGTAWGGWRVIRTLGLRITHLRPINGFAAESTAAAVIESATRLGIPISTTHAITGSIMGVGATRRLSAVRWGVASNIIVAWLLTIPVCFVAAFVLEAAFRLLS